MTYEVREIPVSDLIHHPKNRRKGDVDKIAESLRVHGQYRPLIVQSSTMHVLAGNHTLKAMVKVGMASAQCWVLDVDDDKAYQILIADNQASDDATYDFAGMVADLEEYRARIGNLLGTLVDEKRMAKLTKSIKASSDGSLLDLSDVALGEPKHKLAKGAVVRLGDHVLVVADVITGHSEWVKHLTEDSLFLPYAGLYSALVDKGATRRLVMVQPEPWMAGHIVDRWVDIHGVEAVIE